MGQFAPSRGGRGFARPPAVRPAPAGGLSEVLYMEGIPARMTMGIDIGSTTVKIIIVKNGDVVYQQYERHMSQVRSKTLELIRMARDVIGEGELTVALSGSAGLGVAKARTCPLSRRSSPPARWSSPTPPTPTV